MGWQGLGAAPAGGNLPDCIPCCSNCRSRTSQQHLAAQPGMGATLGTPRTGNMVLRLVQALITSQSLAAAPTASPSLVHHTQTSAEPPGSCTSIFLSCWGFLISLPPALPPFHPSPLLHAPKSFLAERIWCLWGCPRLLRCPGLCPVLRGVWRLELKLVQG